MVVPCLNPRRKVLKVAIWSRAKNKLTHTVPLPESHEENPKRHHTLNTSGAHDESSKMPSSCVVLCNAIE